MTNIQQENFGTLPDGSTVQSYRALLRRSKSMLFLCESETQGMAYQEALASNVPVLRSIVA